MKSTRMRSSILSMATQVEPRLATHPQYPIPIHKKVRWKDPWQHHHNGEHTTTIGARELSTKTKMK